MKKFQMVLSVLAVMSVLSGCTNYAKEYDENTLVVKGNGSFVEIAIEDFEDSSIKAEDLITYIDEEISSYNDEAGKNKVKKVSMDTEDMSKAKLVLKYKDMESYNGFNSLSCTYKDFSEVEESEFEGTFKSSDGKTVKVSDMTDTEKAEVLILSEKANIVVSGDILYYNDEVKVKDGVVTSSGDGNAIIIFK